MHHENVCDSSIIVISDSSDELEVIDLTSDTEIDGASESEHFQKHGGYHCQPWSWRKEVQHTIPTAIADLTVTTDRIDARSTSVRPTTNETKVEVIDLTSDTETHGTNEFECLPKLWGDQMTARGQIHHQVSRPAAVAMTADDATDHANMDLEVKWLSSVSTSGWFPSSLQLRKHENRPQIIDQTQTAPKQHARDCFKHLTYQTSKLKVGWRSDDDSDIKAKLDKKLSPCKPVLSTPKAAVHHCYQTSPGRATVLPTVPKPINSCSNSPYKSIMETQLASFNRKCGRNSEVSSDSDSDLPNPRLVSFSHQKVRTRSPILVDAYPTFKASTLKRELPVLGGSYQSVTGTPKKKTKFLTDKSLFSRNIKNIDANMNSPVRTSSPLRKKYSRPLLTQSDFSSSDDDFEPCAKPFRTPVKTKRHPVAAPSSRSPTSDSSGPCKREDGSSGVPIHVYAQGANSNVKNKLPGAVIRDFCQRQRDMIEAVADENFFDDAILFIRDFANLHRGAPKEYMMYLLKEVLLADGMNEVTVLNAYEALMHIHHLHPTSATSLTINWDLVTAVISRMNLETKSGMNDPSPHLADVLALQFIVIVISDNFRAMKKKNLLRKSYIHSLLSANLHQTNIRHLIHWICSVITNKLNTENSTNSKPESQEQTQERNIWDFLQQFTLQSPKSKPKEPPQPSPPTPTSEGYFRVLLLLQKLLLLSFAIDKDNSTLKIAEELLYPYLNISLLEQRKLCLQTMASDPVRSRLIELILDNLGEMDPREQHMVLSLRKIVEGRFKSRPLQVQQFLGDGRAGLPSTLERQREECEEHAMLLFFLLQSYVRNRAGTLSLDDRECLLQMGDHVDVLTSRLKEHCSCLTFKTRLYLAQMESMRELT